MKICSWNINSVRVRVNALDFLIQSYSPDIILLQEIKCENNQFSEFFENSEYNSIVTGQKGRHGVATLVNKKINSNLYKIHDKSYLIKDKFLLKVKESNSGLTIRVNNFLIKSLRNKSLSKDLLLNKINEALKDVIE